MDGTGVKVTLLDSLLHAASRGDINSYLKYLDTTFHKSAYAAVTKANETKKIKTLKDIGQPKESILNPTDLKSIFTPETKEKYLGDIENGNSEKDDLEK